MNYNDVSDSVKIKKIRPVEVIVAIFAVSFVVVLIPAVSMDQMDVLAAQQINTTPAPPLIPPVAATPVHGHTSAYWLSLWYYTHPQYFPNASDIKAMKANPQDIVPGYSIPLNNTGHRIR